jgi:hypothetical protein
MAEAALKMEEIQVPDGGIADFVMSDEEAAAVYGSDEGGAEEYGEEGLGQFTAVANRMAEMGRGGDDRVAHVQTGELVIPKALLDKDPAWRESILKYLSDNGVENPEQYIVGSEANSLNPGTGIPEFGWFKKAFRKITRAVKKVVKAVVKVVKKVAPIVLPIVLSFTPLGPVFGAALGSGIASLINGGSIKDAMKSALISGVMGGVTAGLTGTGTFMENVGKAVADPIGRFGQTISGAQNSLTSLVGGTPTAGTGAETFFGDYVAPGAASTSSSATAQAAQQGAGQPVTTAQATDAATNFAPGDEVAGFASPAEVAAANPDLYPGGRLPLTSEATVYSAGSQPYNINATSQPMVVQTVGGEGAQGTFQTIKAGQTVPSGFEPTTAYEVPEFGKTLLSGNVKEAYIPTGPTAAQVQLKATTAANQAYNNAMALPGATQATANAAATKAAQAVTASSVGPSLLRTYGPIAATGIGALSASGVMDNFFTAAQQEEVGLVKRDAQGNVITGTDLIGKRPADYLVGDLGNLVLNPETGEYEVRGSSSTGPIADLTVRAPSYSTYAAPTQFAYNFPGAGTYNPVSAAGGPFQRPIGAADGGAIFPRRNGGIMPDEGVPGRDSVRAMLMPGEFVMTTDAVRGVGGGDMNRGIRNMYSIMRDLESRGRRAA